jgi:hypothetical protein
MTRSLCLSGEQVYLATIASEESGNFYSLQFKFESIG